MKILRIFLLGLISSILIQCTSKINSESIPVLKTIRINVDDFKEKGRLSEILKGIEIIPLETNDNCLINTISKVEIYKNSIYILDEPSQQIFLFDKHGKFISKIGAIGNGPGEYIEIIDFTLDSIQELLYIPAINKVNIYNLKGDFIKSEKLKSLVTHMIRLDNNSFACHIEGENKIQILKENFHFKKSFFPASTKHSGWNKFVFNNYNTNILIHLRLCDTIYTLTNDVPYPYFHLNFNGKNFTYSNYKSLNENEKKNLIPYLYNNGSFVRCLSFLPQKNIIHLGMEYNKKGYSAFYNISSNKYYAINTAGLINDLFKSHFHLYTVGKTHNKFIFSIPAHKFVEAPKTDFYKQNIIKLKSLSESSNPVLLLGKAKI